MTNFRMGTLRFTDRSRRRVEGERISTHSTGGRYRRFSPTLSRSQTETAGSRTWWSSATQSTGVEKTSIVDGQAWRRTKYRLPVMRACMGTATGFMTMEPAISSKLGGPSGNRR